MIKRRLTRVTWTQLGALYEEWCRLQEAGHLPYGTKTYQYGARAFLEWAAENVREPYPTRPT